MSVNNGGPGLAVAKEVSVQLRRSPVRTPTGLSFDIPDLLMLQGWVDYHDLRLTIELDVRADGDEYEELLGLYEKDRVFRRWMMWRSCDGIVVQRAMGRTMLFDSMVDALEIMIPPQD
jgi:hypothetical protein